MQKIILLLLLTLSLSAKEINVNHVYSEVIIIVDELHYLLNYYGIKHDHEGIIKRTKSSTMIKPRNNWQITYELMVKINILRKDHELPIIEPVNIAPVLNIDSSLVYEQTQRILTELRIFMLRNGIKHPEHKHRTFKNKTPVDVYNTLIHISRSMDELNKGSFTPSYVFGEQMRLYDDISAILQHLNIVDKTIPKKKLIGAVPADSFNECMHILETIKRLQISVGLDFVDFREFKKGDETPSEVYTITQMILSELQTIKAYIGLENITPAAASYKNKTPLEVHQLASWNLRKLNLVHSIDKGN